MLENDGSNHLQYSLVMRAFNKWGKYNVTLDLYKKAIKMKINDVEIDTIAAYAEFKLGNTEKAVKYLNKSINQDPKYANAYFIRAVIYQELEENEKSQKDYYAAVKNDKEIAFLMCVPEVNVGKLCGNYNADRKMVAEAYMKRGDYLHKKNKESNEALEYYLIATEIDKENQDTFSKVVDYYKSIGNKEQQKHYENIIDSINSVGI